MIEERQNSKCESGFLCIIALTYCCEIFSATLDSLINILMLIVWLKEIDTRIAQLL